MSELELHSKESALEDTNSPADSPTESVAEGKHFYPNGKPYWFRSTFFQANVVGICALLAPGIYNAMQSTGAAGNFTPYLVMRANAILNSLMFIVCFCGSTVAAKIGLKNTFIVGTTGYAIYAAAIYQNNRYGTEWFVYFGAACCGLSAGLFWAAEGAIMIGYPEEKKRGRYLAYWLAFRNSGSIIGGAINLGFNARGKTVGKLNWKTFIVFVVLQALAPFVAAFVSPPDKVQREDRTPVKMERKLPLLQELKEVTQLMFSREVLLVLPLFFYATFDLSYIGSYLTLYFTTRSRALASLVAAFVQILMNIIFGTFLDWKRYSVNQKAKIGFVVMNLLQLGAWIWGTVVQNDYNKNAPKLDWSDSGFGRGWVVYLWYQANFSLIYNYCYWMVGYMAKRESDHVRHTSIVRGIEAAGGAVAAGISSTTTPLIAQLGINFGLWGFCVPFAWFVVKDLGKNVKRETDEEENDL